MVNEMEVEKTAPIKYITFKLEFYAKPIYTAEYRCTIDDIDDGQYE